ncbi:hypothetical protein M3210_16760 [Oceanobacillus luteolus]|uniref:hypothetical protein n=1 Tax=Oceanobacillus luteolus TaxID=1274358 RepID=UPI002041CB64|nr:hypothetical protein [Oceanobacillus luteolus]MCM3741906.1 hypothetical protein [Oceanobacillus luteolus]
MSNRKMTLSEKGKSMLDDLTEQLELDRPFVLQVALAKGIQISSGAPSTSYDKGSKSWTIPDNIIKDDNFTLFKYLIQNEAKKPIDNQELHDYMIRFIESGLRELSRTSQEKTSMEDLRIAIL